MALILIGPSKPKDTTKVPTRTISKAYQLG